MSSVLYLGTRKDIIEGRSNEVVSTKVFSSHFSRFPTVIPISIAFSFLSLTSKLFTQPWWLGGRLSFSFFLLQFMTSQRKLYMVGICSTVRKRAKRTSDTIVKTTNDPKAQIIQLKRRAEIGDRQCFIYARLRPSSFSRRIYLKTPNLFGNPELFLTFFVGRI